MIGAIADSVPASLAAFGDRIAAGCGGPRARAVSHLHDRCAFDSIIDRFGEPYGILSDRRPLVSLWTQFYLAALVIPAVTALLRFDYELAVGLRDIRFELDERHVAAWFFLPIPGRRRERDDPSSRFAGLIDSHLHPFVDLCCAHSGLSRRVLWANAGAVFDLTVRELLGGGEPLVAGALAEAETILGWRDSPPADKTPLTHTVRPASAAGERRRRVCCLRYRLPGVPTCGGLCPVEGRTRTPC